MGCINPPLLQPKKRPSVHKTDDFVAPIAVYSASYQRYCGDEDCAEHDAGTPACISETSLKFLESMDIFRGPSSSAVLKWGWLLLVP